MRNKKVTDKHCFQWNTWAEIGQFLDNAYEATNSCCFEKFLAYTLFLPNFIVVRHQTAELNLGEGGLFCSPSIIRVSRTPSKIGLTLSGPAFQSFARPEGRRGSEAQMPKINVNIRRCQKSTLVLEIGRHKISLRRREQVVKFGYLPPENRFNFKKVCFMSRIVLLDPKLTPPCQFQQFSSRGKFFIFKIF